MKHLSWTDLANRWSKPVTWVSALIVAASVLVIMEMLPVGRGIDWLDGRIDALGAWGPLAYALLYAVALVLLVPGWPMTVAAGALFGPGWGLAAVSFGSTLGAALAFLVARYAARNQVATMIERNPKFKALDDAISDSGWRIVALLRLTPIVPYNLSNYFFGLTAVRFWPYVLATWLFVLPVAAMYLLFGHVGGAGLAGAAGRGSAGVSTWVAWGVGLTATVVLVTYVSRMALRVLGTQVSVLSAESAAPREEPSGWPWRATTAAALALVLAVGAGWGRVQRDSIRSLFGPPAVAMVEAYAPEPDGPRFDHRPLEALLKQHVDMDGRVDYAALRRESRKLDAYLRAVAGAPFDELDRDEKLALLINAYNAFTLRLILDHHPLKSIKDIPASKRWEHERWNVGGHVWSLNQIEHEQIRAKFEEPRIHFALVCAAVGCPPLRREAYTADRLEDQLEDQTRMVHARERWFRYDREENVVWLTRLYDWYGGDFTKKSQSVMTYAAAYVPDLEQALDAGLRPKIRWLEYDWSLNDRKGPRPMSKP